MLYFCFLPRELLFPTQIGSLVLHKLSTYFKAAGWLINVAIHKPWRERTRNSKQIAFLGPGVAYSNSPEMLSFVFTHHF